MKHLPYLRTILAVILFSFIPSVTKGAVQITAEITITAAAGVGSNWVVNGNSRTWTNAAGTPISAWITTGATAGATASNLYSHITRYPYLSPFLILGRTSPTNLTLIGTSLTITTNNYFTVSYTTNTGSSLSIVQVPFDSVVGATNRTNNAHWLIDALNTYPYTNSFKTNANALSNYFGKGATPYQEILGPVGFRGRTAVNSNFFATNGYTKNLTNIDSVSSNHVNFGNALRSEGTGGNSLQLGSNALAKGDLSMAIGNSALASNANSTAIGVGATATNSGATAVGATALAMAANSVAVGSGSTSTADGAVAIYGAASGANSFAAAAGIASGDGSLALMENATASALETHAIGANSVASARGAIAIGTSAEATHSNSVALGGRDHLFTAVTTTDTNQIRLGTSTHRISAPGLYESPKSTNAQFAGTNVARGSWSFPAFALTTLAAGNNISVPFGTNRFIRVGIGPAGAPTICGIIGAATSGGLDGQHVWVFHDCGYPVTYAVNTVDPVAANRINTSTGGDVTFLDQTWAEFIYDGADGRWKLVNAPNINGGVVTVVSGAGSGNTNYTLTATTPKQYLGSSNVMISAVMGYTAGVVNDWTVTVTNLSGGTWGIGFSSVTNRWRFHSSEYGTNAPSVLTNGTALVLRGESEGTNTTVRFNYFSPGL